MSRLMALCFQRSASRRFIRAVKWFLSSMDKLETKGDRILELKLASLIWEAETAVFFETDKENPLESLLIFAESIEHNLSKRDVQRVYSQAIGCAASLLVQFWEPGPRSIHIFCEKKQVFSLPPCPPQVCDHRADYAKRYRLLQRGCEMNNSHSLFALGFCFYSGDGVQQDKEHAFQLFQRASELGNIRATYSLGVCFGFGKGVTKNEEEAICFYRQAASQGERNALVKILTVTRIYLTISLSFSTAISESAGIIRKNIHFIKLL